MAVHNLVAPADDADLHTDLIDYCGRIEALRSPSEVLDGLHAVTTRHLPLAVLGAARFPMTGDWNSLEPGKSAFLHGSVPDGWWEEYRALAQGKFRPMLFLALTSMTSYTWTEVRRMFQPIGVDKWTYELALRYGMRDGFTLSGRRPMGGCILVAQGAFQHPHRADANSDLCSRQRCSISSRATGRSRSQHAGITHAPDAQGVGCPEAGFDRGSVPRGCPRAGPRRRDRAQSSAQGAKQAWRAQQDPSHRRGFAPAPDTLRRTVAHGPRARCRRARIYWKGAPAWSAQAYGLFGAGVGAGAGAPPRPGNFRNLPFEVGNAGTGDRDQLPAVAARSY